MNLTKTGGVLWIYLVLLGVWGKLWKAVEWCAAKLLFSASAVLYRFFDWLYCKNQWNHYQDRDNGSCCGSFTPIKEKYLSTMSNHVVFRSFTIKVEKTLRRWIMLLSAEKKRSTYQLWVIMLFAILSHSRWKNYQSTAYINWVVYAVHFLQATIKTIRNTYVNKTQYQIIYK